MAGALREILAKFGFDVDTSKLDAAKTKTDGVVGGLKALAATIAGTALINGIRGFVSDLAEQAEQLRLTSQQLGISTEDLQRWQGAAKLAGVSNEGLSTGFKFLQKNAAEAATAGGDAAAEFKKLGVNIKDSNGQIKPTSQLMGDVGLAIGAMKNPAERTAAALKLLGRGGLELIPLFNQGEEGLQKFLDRIDELGGGLSAKALANLEQYSRSTKEFDFAILGLKSRLAVELIPKLTDLITWVTKGILAFADMAKGSNIFTAAITVLGTAAALTALKMYLPYLPILALFAALILLVDEVITLFQGGDTLIGEGIDKIFGAGAAAKMVDTLTQAFNELGGTTKVLPALIIAVGAALAAANAPIVATAAAVASVTAAVMQFKKLDQDSGGHGMANWWANAKRNLGITSQEEYQKEKLQLGAGATNAAPGSYEDAARKKGTWYGQKRPETIDETNARQAAYAAAHPVVQGLAGMVPQGPWAGMVPGVAPTPTIPLPPPMLARPPEPVVQRKEIKVTTQSDAKVTFTGPSPDKGDVRGVLSDNAKNVQAAVLAALEPQK